MPFNPSGSRLTTLFLTRFSGLACVVHGKLPAWTRLFRQLSHDGVPILDDIAFTPDGSKLMSMAMSGSLRTWDLLSMRAETVHCSRPDQLRALEGHKLHITTAISPDCRRIAVAASHAVVTADDLDSESCQGLVWIYNSETGDIKSIHRVIAPRKHSAPFCSWHLRKVAFTPDGALLLATDGYGYIHIWDLNPESSWPKSSFHGIGSRSVIAIDTNSRMLATCSTDDPCIFLWNIKEAQLLRRIDFLNSVHASTLVFTQDSTTLICGGTRSVDIVDIRSGTLSRSYPIESVSDYTVVCIATSNDSRFWAVGYWGHICIRSIETGTLLLSFSFEGPWNIVSEHLVSQIAFSPDGRTLVARGSTNESILLWDLQKSTTLDDDSPAELSSEERPLYQYICISPCGRLQGSSLGTRLKIWLVPTGEVLFETIELKPHDVITAIRFTSNGHLLAGLKSGIIFVWDTESRTFLPGYFGNNDCGVPVDISDMWRLASGRTQFAVSCQSRDRNAIRIWDIETRDEVACWKGSQWYSDLDPISIASLSNGHLLAIGGIGENVYLFDTASGQFDGTLSLQTEPPPQAGEVGIMILAWTPKLTSMVHDQGQFTDGYLAAGALSGRTYIWEITRHQKRRIGVLDHCKQLDSTKSRCIVDKIAFSPDGSILASSCVDGYIFLHDVTTGEHLAGPLKALDHAAASLAFSSDGSRLICSRHDALLYAWDVPKVLDRSRTSGASPTTTGTSDTLDHRGSPDGDSDNKSWFNDNTVLDDSGWLRGPNGELLLWIPPHHRTGLLLPSNVAITSLLAKKATKLDFSRFVAGESWAQCYTPEKDPTINNTS
jgi:WD40 repeat protein